MPKENAENAITKEQIEKLDEQIEKIIDRMRRGDSAEVVKKRFKQIKEIDKTIQIAKARITNKKIGYDFFMVPEDLRFATNTEVAKWRAKRLACDVLIEIGCGIGGQTIEFAQTCKKVIAVDKDQRKIEFAMMNMKKYGIKNVEFHCCDGIDFLRGNKGESEIKFGKPENKTDASIKADIIFIDPERLSSEPARTLETIKPPVEEIVEICSKITERVAIELPPQIREVNIKGELEYTSVDHLLNRLTLYLGGLARGTRSAVVLPSGDELRGEPKEAKTCDELKKYLYEIDPAVKQSGLVGEISQCGLFFNDKMVIVTSDELHDSPFFKSRYEVVADANKEDIVEVLTKFYGGKVVLHGRIAQEEYWLMKKEIEAKLTGDEIFDVFFVGEKVIVTRKMRDSVKNLDLENEQT